MRFALYCLWTITAPFFVGGVFWVLSPAVMPLWAVLPGMFFHLYVWATVFEAMQKYRWGV